MQNKQLNAYTNSLLTEKLLIDENYYGCEGIDTLMIVDPVTGLEKLFVPDKDPHFERMAKLRILEDWTFDLIAGKTDIQIVGIAPVQDVYGDDGVYRGSKGMFWVKYNDARSIIARYERYHPENTIAAKIWYDYFLSDTMPAAQK